MSKRYRLGDVVKIRLNKDAHVYGRLMKDASIGIFNILSKSDLKISELNGVEIALYSGVFDTAVLSGEWPIVGNLPFESEDASWPKPTYIQDVINPEKYRIYYKGEMSRASQEQVHGLEQQVMRKPQELIELINRQFG